MSGAIETDVLVIGSGAGGLSAAVTAAKQGLETAAYFWPGTEAAIQGIRPGRWKPYVHTTPNDIRVDTVLSWLDLPPDERLEGTIAAAVLSVERGAHILRVHDVGPVARAVRAAEAVLGAGAGEPVEPKGKDGHAR